MTAWRSSWGDVAELGTHQGYISNPKKCARTTDLVIGCVATFMYDGLPRFAFILNPSYRDPENGRYKMHAATLKFVSRDDVLRVFIPNLHLTRQPKMFYDTIYKPKLTPRDAYRTYLTNKVSQLTMFDYDPGAMGEAKDSGSTTVDEMQDFFVAAHGEFAEQYRQRDRAAMYELFKRGATMKEVEKYYKGIVLKRYAAKYSDAEVMKKFFDEGT
jgi:hypothetical protein